MRSLLLLLAAAFATGSQLPLFIVADGDSRTAGYHNSLGPTSYPSQLAVMLDIPAIQGRNIGVAGAQTKDILSSHVILADSLYSPGSENWYVLWIGFNDLNNSVAQSTTLSNVAQIIAGRRSRGFRVMVLTETPADFVGESRYEGWREIFNPWLLSGASGADFVCDSGSSSDLQDTADTNIFSDRLHLTTEGYRRVASVVSKCFHRARMNVQ